MGNSSASPTAPEKWRGSAKFFFMGIGGALVSILVISCVFYAVRNTGMRTVDPEVDGYFAAFNSGDYAELYANADDALKKNASEEEYIGTLTKIHNALGNYQSKLPRGLQIEATRQGVMTEAIFDATFANGPATMTFVFSGVGEKRKLANVEFSSPLVPESRRERRRG